MIQLYLDLGDVRDENDMTQAIRKKEKAVKASFKIQITDEERKQRDSQQTTEYHTGAGMVTLDKEDQEELQASNLAKIAEEGARESSDDGDADDDEESTDPDEDLGF